MRKGWRRGAVAAILFFAALAVTADAIRPVGPELRLTKIGTDGDPNATPNESYIDGAYNSRRREYLVVDSLTLGNDKFEVYGQRLTKAGKRIGGLFRISNNGLDADFMKQSTDPAVAYDPDQDQYLVVFESNVQANGEVEIYGQRISGKGKQLGGDFRISVTGPDGDPARDADVPAIAYNPQAHNFLVTWRADALTTDNDREIFARRVSRLGNLQGSAQRISETGPEGDATRGARNAQIAYDSKLSRYLVAWEGDDLLNEKFEIYGQLLNSGGAPIGTDVRISVTGGDADAARTAESVDLAYDARRGTYLAAFRADPLATDNDFEIFGRRMSAQAAPIGSGFRISNAGAEGDTSRLAAYPQVAYSRTAREAMVTWQADDLATDDEYEVFARRVAGGRLLDRERRVSMIGADGDTSRTVFLSELVARTDQSQYLSFYLANDLPTVNEFEFFGRLLSAPRCGGELATLVGTTGKDKIKGTGKRDVIAGLGGADVLKGVGGGDVICGGGGKDKLLGGAEKDALYGGKGADKCAGGAGFDKGKSCESSFGIP